MKIQAVDSRIMTMDWENTRIISVYAPHAGHGKQQLMETLTKVHDQCLDATQRKMEIIIGGDFNTSIQEPGYRRESS